MGRGGVGKVRAEWSRGEGRGGEGVPLADNGSLDF